MMWVVFTLPKITQKKFPYYTPTFHWLLVDDTPPVCIQKAYRSVIFYQFKYKYKKIYIKVNIKFTTPSEAIKPGLYENVLQLFLVVKYILFLILLILLNIH